MKRWGILLLVLAFATKGMAQRIRLDLQNVSIAYALTEIDKHFPDTKIQFIYNDLEQYKVTARLNHQKALDAVREVVGFYPLKIKVEQNNIFVESTHKTRNLLTGTLTDEDKLPVPFATIELRNVNDSSYITSGISNEDGYFVIPTDAQEVMMKISSMGYHSLETQTAIMNLGNVQLTSHPYGLNEVIVQHPAPGAQISEGFSIQVIGTPLEHRGTAIDLLSMLPGLKVSDGRLYTLDNRIPNIFINDIPVNTISELFSVQSERISHILFEERETAVRIYTTTPQNGWNTEAQLTASQGKKAAHRENIRVAWNNDHWQLSGGIAYQHVNSYQEHVATDLTKVISPVIQSLNPYAQLVYKPNANHQIGAKYELMDILKDVAYWQQIQHINGGAMNSINNGGMTSERELWLNYSPMHNANLFYKGQLGKVKINLDLDFYNDMLKTRQEDYLSAGSTAISYNRENTIKNTLTEEKLEVNIPVAKHQIVVGNEYSFTKREDDYWYSARPNTMLLSIREEKQLAVFANTQWQLNNITLQARLRYEHVDAKAWGYEPSQSFTSNYFLPSAQAVFKLGDAKVSASLDMQTQRPSYNQLNGYARLNQQIIFVGVNPDLKQALLHNLNLEYRSKNLYAHIKYQYIKNYIGNHVTYNTDSYKLNYCNLPSAQNIIATLLYSTSWGKFKPSLSTSFLCQNLRMNFEQQQVTFKKPVWFIDLHLPVLITSHTQLWTDAHFHTTGHIGTMLQEHSGNLNLGISHQLKNWNFSLHAEDMLKTAHTAFTCYGNNLSYRHWNYNDTRRVLLSVSYRLNPSSVIKKNSSSSKERNRF